MPAESYVQRFEDIAEEVEGKISAAISDVVGDSAATKFEAWAKEVLSTALGTLALKAVQDARDVESGTVNVQQAIANFKQAAAASGKSVEDATATSIIGAAQAALTAKANS